MGGALVLGKCRHFMMVTQKAESVQREELVEFDEEDVVGVGGADGLDR